jgi:DNA-binding CsgD family transcriptional regulator
MWQSYSYRKFRPALHGPALGEDDFLATLKSAPLSDLSAKLAALTPQERIILDLIVRGRCNKEISNILNIEITTTKAHASHIFKKIGAKNRAAPETEEPSSLQSPAAKPQLASVKANCPNLLHCDTA